MNKVMLAIEQLEMQIKSTVNTTSINTCRLAIEALEKQIPKKVENYAETEEEYEHTKCPNCKEILGTIPMIMKNNHCIDCGQKLDWSVEE